MSGLRLVRRSRWLLTGVVALSLAATAAACGSGGSNGSPGPTGTAAAAAALGTKNPAAGKPITLGFISASASDSPVSAQFKRVEAGLQMARGYLNDYQGGIAGHPVELFICQGNETPAGTQDCANQMVNKGVAAVIAPYSGQGAVITPILTKAGIPYVVQQGTSTEELTTPGAFTLTGGFPSTLASYAQYAKDHGVKKFALLTIDVPSAVQAAQGIGTIVFKNAGVGYQVVTVPVGTPDMSSQLQSAASGGADAIGVVGDLTFCAAWMQAYQTLGLSQAKYVLSTCIDPSNVKAYGPVINGSVMSSIVTTDLQNPDAKLYAAIAQTYGKDVNPDPNVSSGQSGGASTLLSFASALKGLTGDPTPAAVLTAFKATKNVPLFLGGGATFTCDGKQVSILPNICSGDVQVGLLNDQGRLEKATLVHTADLFTL